MLIEGSFQNEKFTTKLLIFDPQFRKMTACHYCGSQLNIPGVRKPPSGPDNARRVKNPLRWELEETELELTRVQALLDHLIEKRSSLKQKLNDRESPALRLPDEISLEVLMNCLPASNSPITPGNLEMTPFQLGHICRSWRYIVWSAPKLWSIVTLDVLFHTNFPLVME
jgi:F-box-like